MYCNLPIKYREKAFNYKCFEVDIYFYFNGARCSVIRFDYSLSENWSLDKFLNIDKFLSTFTDINVGIDKTIQNKFMAIITSNFNTKEYLYDLDNLKKYFPEDYKNDKDKYAIMNKRKVKLNSNAKIATLEDCENESINICNQLIKLLNIDISEV